VTFLDGGIKQDLRLDFAGDVSVRRIVEQLPYLKKQGAAALFETAGGWSGREEGLSRRLWIGRERGEGVLFEFSAPVRLAHGLTSRTGDIEIGLVEVALGREFRAGEAETLSYVMLPRPRPPGFSRLP
jgi:hypothetical protein